MKIRGVCYYHAGLVTGSTDAPCLLQDISMAYYFQTAPKYLVHVSYILHKVLLSAYQLQSHGYIRLFG